jgi:hypothetical protein
MSATLAAKEFVLQRSPKGIRIPVSALRGRRPRPLDDGAKKERSRGRGRTSGLLVQSETCCQLHHPGRSNVLVVRQFSSCFLRRTFAFDYGNSGKAFEDLKPGDRSEYHSRDAAELISVCLAM